MFISYEVGRKTAGFTSLNAALKRVVIPNSVLLRSARCIFQEFSIIYSQPETSLAFFFLGWTLILLIR